MTQNRSPIRLLTFLGIFLPLLATGQSSGDPGDGEEPERVRNFTTFRTTRLVNAHSVETLHAKDLDFRITHRFGDIAGDQGSYHTLYGIDRARDIRIALEYGITENLMIGGGRSKGAGPWRELFDGFAKFRLLRQTKDFSMPVSLTYVGTVGGSSMEASDEGSSPVAFTKVRHRYTYANQLVVASRLSDRLSLQLIPSHIHRNLVAFGDENDLYALGGAGTLKISKIWAISMEYFAVFPNERNVPNTTYHNPLSLGVEIETGGHIFHVNLSNSSGIGPNQFIPYTTEDWLDGEFRFGFTISRLFNF